MALPEISGLPASIKLPDMLNSLTMRYEYQGTLVTLNVAGEHDFIEGDVVIRTGRTARGGGVTTFASSETYQMVNRRLKISSNSPTTTTYTIRPKTPLNKLFWMDEVVFLEELQKAASGGSDTIRNLYQTYGRGIIDLFQVGALILQDLVMIDDDGEIGFQEAADIMIHYGLGVNYGDLTNNGNVSPSGSIYGLDDARNTITEGILMNEVEFNSDGVDYSMVPVGCKYNITGATEELIIPEGDDVRWVDDLMPNENQARLEIFLQRRRLERAANLNRFTMAIYDAIRPRDRFTFREKTYHIDRVVHSFYPDETPDVTEVEAWCVGCVW